MNNKTLISLPDTIELFDELLRDVDEDIKVSDLTRVFQSAVYYLRQIQKDYASDGAEYIVSMSKQQLQIFLQSIKAEKEHENKN